MQIIEWISANIATIVVAAVLFLIVALIVKSKLKEHKQGGCGCGCPGCTGSCPHTASIGSNKNKTEEKTNEA